MPKPLITLACGVAALGAAPAAHAARWPSKVLSIGVASQPGDGLAKAPLGFRYQYLAGGVNTGKGWSTWNPGGTFVSRYVGESRGLHITPVLTYYMLLQSKPAAGGDEAAKDLANLRDAATMRAYWSDLQLALKRAKGRRPVVLHIEPDLWGYIEQNAKGDRAATIPAAVASSGDTALKGLPNNAAGFAKAVIRLRNRLAKNVVLAWHLSGWGTKVDIGLSDPPRKTIAQLARRSARFYKSLGARFDIVFNDVADRDAGYREKVLGDGGRSAWNAGDFHRHAAYIRGFTRRTHKKVVVWQIPLGNSTLPNTDGRYRDNRVEWWLGRERTKHLREARRAGIVALLFGGGADGTTSPKTDGGLFYRLARAYLRR